MPEAAGHDPDPLDAYALAADAEAVCRRLAPVDLAGMPVYVVLQSRLPRDLGGDSTCGGWTAPALDLALAGVIGDGWRGRGPCMVINDTIPAAAGWPADRGVEWFRSVAVHELAHVLDRPAPFATPSAAVTPAMLREVAVESAAWLSCPDAVRDRVRGSPDDHGPGFVRLLCHLLDRADRAGVDLDPFTLAGVGYRLSSLRAYYLPALGDEHRTAAGRPLRELWRVPVPERVVALWEDDADPLPGPPRSEAA